MASKWDRSEENNSLASVARVLVDKVGSAAEAVGNALKQVVPWGRREQQQPPTRRPQADRSEDQDDAWSRRRRGGLSRPADLSPFGGGGILGNLMGRAMAGVMSAVAEQMQAAQAQTAEIQERAAALIAADARVAQRLGGGATAGPPVSQSSMTQVVNGRSAKRVSLVLPVVGPSGRMAQAQVDYTEGEGQQENLTVAVRMPEGDVIRVGSGAGRGGGTSSGRGGSTVGPGGTIDVEWREVR